MAKPQIEPYMSRTPQLPRKLRNVLDASEKMLIDLALGTDSNEVLAERYGVEELDIEVFAARPDVIKAVTARQTELSNKGEFFRIKARIMAESLLEKIFKDAKQTDDPKTRLDAVKFLSLAGGVDKPPVDMRVGSGRQVNISIDLGAATSTGSITLNFGDMFGYEDDDGVKHLTRNAELIAEGEYEEVDGD